MPRQHLFLGACLIAAYGVPSTRPEDGDMKIKNTTILLSRSLCFSGKHVKTKTGTQRITLRGRSGTQVKAKIPVAWEKEGPSLHQTGNGADKWPRSWTLPLHLPSPIPVPLDRHLP